MYQKCRNVKYVHVYSLCVIIIFYICHISAASYKSRYKKPTIYKPRIPKPYNTYTSNNNYNSDDDDDDDDNLWLYIGLPIGCVALFVGIYLFVTGCCCGKNKTRHRAPVNAARTFVPKKAKVAKFKRPGSVSLDIPEGEDAGDDGCTQQETSQQESDACNVTFTPYHPPEESVPCYSNPVISDPGFCSYDSNMANYSANYDRYV